MTLEGFKKDLIDIIRTFVPALALAWFLTTFIVANAIVPSGSMENTIMTGSRLIGNRLAYKFGEEPKLGDVIIFKYPDDESTFFIKRLIGTPGDTVEIVQEEDGYGYVKVNGVRINEPYLPDRMVVEGYKKYEVPEGCYFFLGDNRNHSHDARYWDTTFVTEDQLVAKAIFQYWKGFQWIK